MTKLILGLLVFVSVSAHAFSLKCSIEADYYEGHSWKSRTYLDCIHKKKGLNFLGKSNEVGPGIRDIFYYADGKIPKIVTINCPFMRAKKLQEMKLGDSLVVKGIVADVNALVGVRLGVSVGEPGVCFIGGISALELFGEVAFETLKLTKY